ncbi:hypothetical protein [Synoicihabitans lomoniglobus]|uniref:Uncharacterized protein n=1 Tax=Synoicihabitans lomoniglobus TaxID=2909285 RepID=A0AAE9ZY64_9BACT|nr:hypothetical protein [Opitutaceae bacterium LMO-M01]WED64748.1 hypothetical protein PXH66_20585 [Opitutaceae bacterium LMO-M01]
MSASEHPNRQELARELLLYKMQEYSQDGFCASWLHGLEWELWEAAEPPNAPAENPFIFNTSRECRQLAEIAQGWWVFEDQTQPDTESPVFVSLERWQQTRSAGNRPPIDPLEQL